MERRVLYNDFLAGIQYRRDAKSIEASGTSSIYSRQTKAGQGYWWTNGCDTRLADRIFAQRSTGPSGAIASSIVAIGDAGGFQYIACKQHVYYLNGMSGGQQALALSKDFSSIIPAVNITDVAVFGGKLWVATAQLTNGIADPAKAQPLWMWDMSTPTSNWLQQPTVPGTPSQPGLVTAGTPGSTRYDYYVVARNANTVGIPSPVNSIVTGNAVLNTSNYITITWSSVGGATGYDVYRAYSAGTPNSVGCIATNTSGTTLNDTGLSVVIPATANFPATVIGDSGKANAFAVIRNQLWRAAGSLLWVWDGLSSSWSSTYVITIGGSTSVGDPSSPITYLDVYRDGLIVFKQDGLYTVERDGTVMPLFPGFRTLGWNPRPLCAWRGAYYFATDVGNIWEWDASKVTHIGFDSAEPYPMQEQSATTGLQTVTYGIPNAVTRGIGLSNMMVVGFNRWGSPNYGSWFLAYDGKAWHGFKWFNSYQATAIGITGGQQVPPTPTLQFGTFDTTAHLFFMQNPTLDPFLVNNFDTIPCDIYFNSDSGAIEDEDKIFEHINAFVDHPLAGTVNLSYALDQNIIGQNWTPLGSPFGDGTIAQTFTPGLTIGYKKVGIKATLQATNGLDSVQLRSLILRYKQLSPRRRAYTILLYVEGGQLNPNNQIENRSSTQMVKALETLRDTRGTVKFIDPDRMEHFVYVDSVGQKLHTTRFAQSGFPSWVVEVKLVEPTKF